MKKQHFVKLSLAAAAVVGTLAGGNAMADVTVFGVADAGVIQSKAASTGATSSTAFSSGNMTTSAFGVKGTEDLGGGLSANFALSSFLDLSKGSYLGGNLFARDAWVSLASKQYGALSMGRDVNPSFLPTIIFNAYGDSVAFSPLWHATYFDYVGRSVYASGGNYYGQSASNGLYDDTAWNGQFRYSTPDMGGVKADLMYAPNSTSGDNFGGNVMYFNGPVGLSAYYMSTQTHSTGSTENNIYGTTGGKASTAYFVGGSYDLGMAKVFATYQTAKQSSTGIEATTYHMSSQIPYGPGKVLLSYANTVYKNGSTTTFNDMTSTQTAVGYSLPLSKSTDVYASYLYATEKDTASRTGSAFGAGIRKFF